MHHLKLKSRLLIGVALLGATAGAAPAFAQDAGQLAEVVVTARRVEERLQDVPISITVFNQAQLTKNNVAVANDLATYTPSLTVNPRYGPEKSSFNIRGFNQDANTAPTVGVYFAEVVGVRAQGGTTSGNTVGAGAFTDLQNVQVLKGPQGTLFGRNTTGGAILLTPQKPVDRYEGYVEGTYGNYGQKRLQAALNVPVTENFRLRAALDHNKRDGYMKNKLADRPDYNNIDYTYGRLSAVWDVTPELENYTVAHYSRSRGNGYATRIVGCATPTSPIGPLNTTRGTPGFSGTRLLQATSCADQLARQTARGDGLYDIEVRNPNPFLNIDTWQIINTTTWQVNDNITVKNIASYGEFKERANFDLGSSNFAVANVGGTGGFNLQNISPFLPPLVVPAGTLYDRITLDTAGPGTANAAQKTYTEELQIQGRTDDDRFNYVIGGYLEFARPDGFSAGRTGIFLNCQRPATIQCTNPLLFGSISESSTKIKFDNHGIFGQGTYKFTDQLSLTAGVRYTFDKIDGYTNSTRASLDPTGRNPNSFIDPISGVRISRACTDSFRHLTATPGLNRDVCITRLVNKSDKPTWVIDLDYKPTDDMLFYAKYARGYRQGGLNFTNPGMEMWAPEKTDNYEVGAKTSFRGAVSGYFNLAAFYNKLQNQQIFAALTPTPAAAATGVAGGNAVINAGRSRIYGLEADGSVLLTSDLRLDASYTYLNTKLTKIASQDQLNQLLVGTPFGAINPTVAPGSAFTNAPKHKLTLSATYTLPVDESVGRISASATWVHTSSYINDASVPQEVNGIPLGKTPSTDLVNLNLDWRGIAGSPVDAAIFVTNLTKEKFNVANAGGWNSAGVAEILLNQPRFYGVRIRYSFGQ